MRLAYRSLAAVLSESWTDELHEATSDLAIVAYDRDLDRVTKEDVPVAAEILARAKYFIAVLDEDPPTGLSGGERCRGETEAERVQRAAHYARVGVWDLKSGVELAHVRRRAEGRFVPVGESVVSREEIVFAQQRQANSCALALEVRSALTPKQPEPDSDAGAASSDAGTSDAARKRRQRGLGRVRETATPPQASACAHQGVLQQRKPRW